MKRTSDLQMCRVAFVTLVALSLCTGVIKGERSLAPKYQESTVQGGMSVHQLRIVAEDNRLCGLRFGTDDRAFEFSLTREDSFVLKSPQGTPIIKATKDGTIELLADHIVADTIDIRGGLTHRGVSQFRLVHREDLTEGQAKGWDNPLAKEIISQCGSTTMIGGFGKFAKGEIAKKINGLPSHSELRLRATFHFIDAWAGETGFARLDAGQHGKMEYVWTERHVQDLQKPGVNVCGSKVAEGKFAAPIDVAIPHAKSETTISFGSTLMSDDPFDSSWGVSGIELYVR